MTSIDLMLNRVQKLKRGLNGILEEEVDRNEEQILDLNREDQLYAKGEDARGKQIQPPYTASTRRIKARKNQPTNRVTLRDKGDFHNSFFITTLRDSFIINADDPKTQRLGAKYGKNILGLSRASRAAAGRIIAPGILRTFRKLLIGR